MKHNHDNRIGATNISIELSDYYRDHYDTSLKDVIRPCLTCGGSGLFGIYANENHECFSCNGGGFLCYSCNAPEARCGCGGV